MCQGADGTSIAKPPFRDLVPDSGWARPPLAHIMKGDNAARSDVRKEALEVGEDILVFVGAIDKQEIDGLIPAARDFMAHTDDGLDVFGQAATLDVGGELF